MRGIWMIVLGILAAMLAQPARAEGFARCEQADYLPSFDARLHPEPCEVVASATVHWRGGSSIVRVIRPRSLPAGTAPRSDASFRKPQSMSVRRWTRWAAG